MVNVIMSADDVTEEKNLVSPSKANESTTVLSPCRAAQSEADDHKNVQLASKHQTASPNFHYQHLSQNSSARHAPSWYFGYPVTTTMPGSPPQTGSSPFAPMVLTATGFQTSNQYSPNRIFGSPGSAWSESAEINTVVFPDDNFDLTLGTSFSANQHDLIEAPLLNVASEPLLYFTGTNTLPGYDPRYASLQEKSLNQVSPWKLGHGYNQQERLSPTTISPSRDAEIQTQSHSPQYHSGDFRTRVLSFDRQPMDNNDYTNGSYSMDRSPIMPSWPYPVASEIYAVPSHVPFIAPGLQTVDRIHHERTITGHSYYNPSSPGPPIQLTPSNKGPDGANLFVFHIPNNFSNIELWNLFRQFGNVISVRIMVEKDSGRSRGFGFVSYDSSVSAALAIKELNGYVIGNKRLKVQHKQMRPSDFLNSVSRFGVDASEDDLDPKHLENVAHVGQVIPSNVSNDTMESEGISGVDSNSNTSSGFENLKDMARALPCDDMAKKDG